MRGPIPRTLPFYATPGIVNDYVRIAYILETGKLARAMEIFTAGLEAYPGRMITARTERAGG